PLKHCRDRQSANVKQPPSIPRYLPNLRNRLRRPPAAPDRRAVSDFPAIAAAFAMNEQCHIRGIRGLVRGSHRTHSADSDPAAVDVRGGSRLAPSTPAEGEMN